MSLLNTPEAAEAYVVSLIHYVTVIRKHIYLMYIQTHSVYSCSFCQDGDWNWITFSCYLINIWCSNMYLILCSSEAEDYKNIAMQIFK